MTYKLFVLTNKICITTAGILLKFTEMAWDTTFKAEEISENITVDFCRPGHIIIIIIVRTQKVMKEK